MERVEFETVYNVSNTDERLKLKILWMAYVNNIKEFEAAGRQKNLKLWQEAEKALDHKAKELRAKYLSRAPVYENRLAAFNHLQDQGYKIGRQKLYNDAAKGFLAVEEDGTILNAELARYATTLVKVGEDNGDSSATAEAKQRAEIDIKKEQYKSLVMDNDIKAGKYMLSIEVKRELAIKAAALKAGLYHAIDTELREVLIIGAADLKNTQACAQKMKSIIDDTLHQYASPIPIEVNITDAQYGFD